MVLLTQRLLYNGDRSFGGSRNIAQREGGRGEKLVLEASVDDKDSMSTLLGMVKFVDMKPNCAQFALSNRALMSTDGTVAALRSLFISKDLQSNPSVEDSCLDWMIARRGRRRGKNHFIGFRNLKSQL